MSTSVYLTSSSTADERTFQPVSNKYLLMTIHAVGGDVTVTQLVNGTYETLGTVSSGAASTLDYGYFSSNIRLTVASAAQVAIK